MIETIKFSQMPSGGDLANNEMTPGLQGGANVLFNNPWVFLAPGSTAQRPAPSSDINYRLRFNTDDQLYEYYDAISSMWVQIQASGSIAGPFVTYTADATLPGAQNLGALSNGILKQTVTSGSATINIAVNGTDYYAPGFVIPGTDGGTGVNNGSLTINLGSATTGYVLTSDSMGNATWQANPASGSISTIDGDSGSISPISGTVIFTGSSTGLTFSGSGNTMSLGGTLGTIHGGTGLSSTTINQILYSSANNVISGLSTLDNGVLVTSASGVPSISTTLPSSLTIPAPIINDIFDSNGKEILMFSPQGSAVNFATLFNNSTGANPGFGATGNDTDVGLTFMAKAAGVFVFNTTASSDAVVFYTGTANQHVTNLSFPNTNANQIVTFQDASGTLAFLSDIPGAITPSALTEVNDTNVTLTLSGTPATSLLQAVTITAGWTGQLGLTRGGTNASLTASNGGIVYSSASAMAILAGTATANLPLLSGSNTTPSWSPFALSLGGALTTAGALTTSGAFSSTFTFTNTTNVTFPTSGTLATTSGSVVTIDGDSGSAAPSSGILTISGGSTGLTTTASGSTVSLTGTLKLANGGTNNSLIASAGGIVWSDSTKLNILAGTSTANQLLLSGNSSTPVWSTTTYPTTNAINTLLYASSANTMAALPTGNNGVLITSNSGVPSWLANGTAGYALVANSGAPPSWQAVGAVYTASALTATNDTNVTLSLGGTPSTALLQATSLTLGWTGTLSGTRGGTGINNGANTATFAGNLNFANSFTTSGNFAVTQTYTGATNVTFPTSGTLATTSQLPTPAALTEINDTNVTLTLGGTPSTSLLQAVSITAGWTGQLSVPRGGTGDASFTAYSLICAGTTSTGNFQNVVGLGTAGQILISNGASALPSWQNIPATIPDYVSYTYFGGF